MRINHNKGKIDMKTESPNSIVDLINMDTIEKIVSTENWIMIICKLENFYINLKNENLRIIDNENEGRFFFKDLNCLNEFLKFVQSPESVKYSESLKF